MLSHTLTSFILVALTSQAILHEKQQHAHDHFNSTVEKVVRASLQQAESAFQDFDFHIKNLQLNVQWTHGNLPVNQISFKVVSSENSDICSLNFSVEAFQDHIIEELANRESHSDFYEQTELCAHGIRNFTQGPQNKTEEIKNLIEEINEDANNPFIQVDHQNALRNVLYKTINENPIEANHALQELLNEYQQSESSSSEEEGPMNVQEVSKDLMRVMNNIIKKEAEEDPVALEEIEQLIVNKEITFNGLEEPQQKALVTKIEEVIKVQKHPEQKAFAIPPKKKETESEDYGLEEFFKTVDSDELGLKRLFKSVEDEAKSDSSEEELVNRKESSSSSESETFKSKKPVLTITPSALNFINTHNNIMNLLKKQEDIVPKQADNNLALVLYKPQPPFAYSVTPSVQQILDSLAKIPKLPVFKPAGAERKCEILVKKLVINKLADLVIANQMQNVLVFEENVSDCNERISEKIIDAILVFNEEKCYISIKSEELENVKVLGTVQARDFSLDNKGIQNCLNRFGTDQGLTESH